MQFGIFHEPNLYKFPIYSMHLNMEGSCFFFQFTLQKIFSKYFLLTYYFSHETTKKCWEFLNFIVVLFESHMAVYTRVSSAPVNNNDLKENVTREQFRVLSALSIGRRIELGEGRRCTLLPKMSRSFSFWPSACRASFPSSLLWHEIGLTQVGYGIFS